MNRKSFKIFSCTLAAALALGQFAPVLANSEFVDVSERAASKYQNGEFAFTKISHPEKPASTRENPSIDGIIDYLGNGKLGAPLQDAGANNQGDRGQQYSWASASYGDYMYVGTLENAMMNTVMFMGQGGLGIDFDQNVLEAGLDLLFRGDFFIAHEDKATSGGALTKINVKTGETEIIMSKSKTGHDCQFRNGLSYNDKLYFCGSVNMTPAIYEVDPKTDEFKLVYQDESMKDPNAWKEALEKQIGPAIRGMGVYDDYLVISCLGLDGNPYIAVSNDPSKGFTKIASTFNKDGSKGDLFGYPAFHFQDSIYGGGIWEMIEFNNDLYVAMCTGTPENSKDGGKTFQSFAIVRGECNGEINDADAWTWTPVIGDKADGAKYTFGIDPERTRSGACNMMVYNDHLYIGEYNDSEIAMIRMMFDLDFEFMADNLEQSVSLYRMDKDENIELVAGNPTEMFPTSITGLHSGFGDGKTRYENQYIWKMDTFQDNLYIGTFDETTLLYPFAQISNGDLLHMSKDEWKVQLEYVKEFLKVALESLKKPVPQTFAQTAIPSEEKAKIDAAAKQVTEKDLPALEELYEAQVEMEETLSDMEDVDILSLPSTLSENDEITSLSELQQAIVFLGECLEANDEDAPLEDMIASHEHFLALYNKVNDYICSHNELPQYIKDTYDKLVNNEGVRKVKSLVRCLWYLKDSESGFDMFEFNGKDQLQTITTNGMSDPYNHGLRAFAMNRSEENPWMCIGTANPCYGTQVWRMEGEGLNVVPMEDKDEPIVPVDPVKPETKPETKPEVKPEETDKESVQTGDTTSKAMLYSTLLASLALIGTVAYKRRKLD